jgi:hypothetical protein
VVTKPVAGNTNVIVRSEGWDSVMEALEDVFQTTMNLIGKKLEDDETIVD